MQSQRANQTFHHFSWLFFISFVSNNIKTDRIVHQNQFQKKCAKTKKKNFFDESYRCSEEIKKKTKETVWLAGLRRCHQVKQ